MSRSYRIDMFAETGFNAVDIPCSPQLLYDNFEVFKRYQDLPIVQDEWEANIKVDDLTPEEVRKIDYVIIVDELDTTKMTCYTVKNYKFLSDDVVQINLLLDPYNTMGGFIKGSNDNIVIGGSANRLTVPLHHKDGVYERSEDNDFFVLDEPFNPAQKLVMNYEDFNFGTSAPEQYVKGGIGLVQFNIMFTRGAVNTQRISYLDLTSFKMPVDDEQADNIYGIVPFSGTTVNDGTMTEEQFYETANDKGKYIMDYMYHILGKYYLTFNWSWTPLRHYKSGYVWEGITYNSKNYGLMLFFSKDNSGDDSQGEVRRLIAKMQECLGILASQLLVVRNNYPTANHWNLQATNTEMTTKWLMIYAQAINLYQNAIYEGDGLTDSIVRVYMTYNGGQLEADIENIDLTKVTFLVDKGGTKTEIPFSV